MNAISRNAFASLTLLLALSAFLQISGVDKVAVTVVHECSSPMVSQACEMNMITGSTSKTADMPTRTTEEWVQI